MNLPETNWNDRLRRLRKRLDLDQDEMGALLGVSREWISKLERNREEVSELLRLKIAQNEEEKPVHMVSEERGREVLPRPQTAESLVDAIRGHIEDTIRAADDRPSRLGWVLEQLRSHVRPPDHWNNDVHGRLINRMLSEEAEAAKTKPQSSPGKTHGAAGS